jgi:hypothetical protein
VDILIGDEDEEDARSVAGPNAAWIKGGNNLRNFIQLTVVEKETGEIIDLAEAYRYNSEASVTIKLPYIPSGKYYHFLLLMGHWEKDGDDKYVTTPNYKPTLFAAGF